MAKHWRTNEQNIQIRRICQSLAANQSFPNLINTLGRSRTALVSISSVMYPTILCKAVLWGGQDQFLLLINFHSLVEIIMFKDCVVQNLARDQIVWTTLSHATYVHVMNFYQQLISFYLDVATVMLFLIIGLNRVKSKRDHTWTRIVDY
jgi:hypothetical protein